MAGCVLGKDETQVRFLLTAPVSMKYCTHGEIVDGVRVTLLQCNCGYRIEQARKAVVYESRLEREHGSMTLKRRRGRE